jgi:hypothetical protein
MLYDAIADAHINQSMPISLQLQSYEMVLIIVYTEAYSHCVRARLFKCILCTGMLRAGCKTVQGLTIELTSTHKAGLMQGEAALVFS